MLFERLTEIKKGKKQSNCFGKAWFDLTLDEFFELQQEFTSNLRRFRSNLKKRNPFGLPEEQTKELKTLIAKERYNKIVEKKNANAEFYENLPAIVQKVTSTLINLTGIQYEDRTLTPQRNSEKDSISSAPQSSLNCLCCC